MRLLHMLIAAGFWVNNPANAAEIRFNKNAIDGTGVIFVEGEIRPGDEVRFREISLQVRAGVVFLDSNGGAILPALEIGKIVRVAGYDTAVLYDNVCASSCALIWLAGTERQVMGEGRVGFHAAYRDNQGKLEEVGAANALIGSYLTTLGLPTRAIVFATTAPPDKILWLSDVNPKSSGIEYTRVVGPPPPIQTQPFSPRLPAPPAIQTMRPAGFPQTSTAALLSTLSRSGEKWTKLIGFQNAYYDRSSSKISKTKRIAWILYDYSQQSSVQSSYEMKLTEVDCKKGTYRVDRTVTKDRDQEGSARSVVPAPGSLERALTVHLCSNQ